MTSQVGPVSQVPDGAREADPWRIAEWRALPDECLIAGCNGGEIDQRGPVFLRNGQIHKACTEHWEPIFRVLGEQSSWERTDGARGVPVSGEEQRDG